MKRIILLSLIFVCFWGNQSFAQSKNKAETKNYDFSSTSELFKNIEVPDFLDFVTGKATPVDNLQVDKHRQNAYGFTYYGSYSGKLEKYIKFIETQGFVTLINDYEGFYLLEKKVGKHFLQVHTHYLNEADGVQVDIILKKESSKLSKEQIEAEILKIRKVYNEIVQANYTKTRLTVGNMDDIIVYSDKDGNVRRIDIPKSEASDYARFYYFQNGMPLFAYFEGIDSYRLYFYMGALIRSRSTDPRGDVGDYDYGNDEDSRKLAGQMNKENAQILQAFEN